MYMKSDQQMQGQSNFSVYHPPPSVQTAWYRIEYGLQLHTYTSSVRAGGARQPACSKGRRPELATGEILEGKKLLCVSPVTHDNSKEGLQRQKEHNWHPERLPAIFFGNLRGPKISGK